jgi:hypothetical protein
MFMSTSEAVLHADPFILSAPALAGHGEVIRFLVEKVGVSFGGEEGFTALHAACQRGHQGVMAVLLELGCGRDVVSRRTVSGYSATVTPLAEAAMGGWLGCVKALTSVVIGDKSTPSLLALAVLSGRVDIVRIVFEKLGSVPRDRDEAYSVAMMLGHEAVLSYLGSSAFSWTTYTRALLSSLSTGQLQTFVSRRPIRPDEFARCFPGMEWEQSLRRLVRHGCANREWAEDFLRLVGFDACSLGLLRCLGSLGLRASRVAGCLRPSSLWKVEFTLGPTAQWDVPPGRHVQLPQRPDLLPGDPVRWVSTAALGGPCGETSFLGNVDRMWSAAAGEPRGTAGNSGAEGWGLLSARPAQFSLRDLLDLRDARLSVR